MVLSNKKLKQKLRAALPVVEPVANSGAGSNKIPQTTVPKISDASLKEAKQQLLPDAAAIQKLRLSKREKRRKLRSSGDGSKIQTEEGANGNEVKPSSGAVGDVGEKPEKRKKKRKRDQKETEENGGGDGAGDGEVKKIKKKKNANNKKKKKWSKKNDKAENKKSEEAAKNDDEIKTAVVAASNSTTAVNSDNDRRKVYAGGIPYYSSEDDIRSFFESCGTITELDCMMFPESGKFRGIAIITFKTEEAAKRALALDGADMGGLFLKIQYYNKPTTARGGNSKAITSSSNFAPPVVEGYNRIYMGNLSWDITEDDLRKFLSGCNISSIRFGMDKVTGEFRGYAHVDFSDSLSMNMAMKLDQQILCGRPVKVTSAIPKNLQVLSNTTSTTSAAPVAVAVVPTTATAISATNVVAAADASVAADVGYSEPVVSSGKLRRRTCYECGEKGHISSECPQKPADDPPAAANVDFSDISMNNMAMKLEPVKVTSAVSKNLQILSNTTSAPVAVVPTTTTISTTDASVATADVAYSEAVVSSGKLRRRTCYECGEKGHISSECPKKPADDPPPAAAHVDFSDSLSMNNMAMKQEQHILSGRPVKVISKNLQILSNTTAPVAVVPTTTISTTDASVATDVGYSEPVVSSGKLRRRTCYVCGEKGHISSACPQKPADDPPPSTL